MCAVSRRACLGLSCMLWGLRHWPAFWHTASEIGRAIDGGGGGDNLGGCLSLPCMDSVLFQCAADVYLPEHILTCKDLQSSKSSVFTGVECRSFAD